MEDGGIDGCGNSQNCVRACLKGIPLTTSITEINKQTTKHMFKRWLGYKTGYCPKLYCHHYA
ncbi:hypothetical protein A3842_24780 [Paenibacillus sp. P3E]|nr:hypothetical protein A3842_24780 [Paenibacillus sp. P3E]